MQAGSLRSTAEAEPDFQSTIPDSNDTVFDISCGAKEYWNS
jgi:hypothetical protein